MTTPVIRRPVRQQDQINAAVKAIYRRHSAGCCQHLVLDDENVDDASLLEADRAWKSCGYADCFVFNRSLGGMTEGERLAAIEEAKYRPERETE